MIVRKLLTKMFSNVVVSYRMTRVVEISTMFHKIINNYRKILFLEQIVKNEL